MSHDRARRGVRGAARSASGGTASSRAAHLAASHGLVEGADHARRGAAAPFDREL